MDKHKPWQNASGLNDPTPYAAIGNIDRAKHWRENEAQAQEAVFEWIALHAKRFPGLALAFHVPNGGSRHKAEAVNLKRQGVRSGVPDIFIPIARQGYHGMFIEMKAKGGRIKQAQADYINAVREQGYITMICYGSDEAIEWLEWYLRGEV
jgi:hypothetical protein